jgi:hypothetical protein
MAWAGHLAYTGMRNAYNFFVGKYQEKSPLGRPKHIWEGYI